MKRFITWTRDAVEELRKAYDSTEGGFDAELDFRGQKMLKGYANYLINHFTNYFRLADKPPEPLSVAEAIQTVSVADAKDESVRLDSLLQIEEQLRLLRTQENIPQPVVEETVLTESEESLEQDHDEAIENTVAEDSPKPEISDFSPELVNEQPRKIVLNIRKQ